MIELDMKTIVYMLGYEGVGDAFSVSRLARALNDDDLDIDIDTLWVLACALNVRFPGCFQEQLDYIEMRIAEGEEE